MKPRDPPEPESICVGWTCDEEPAWFMNCLFPDPSLLTAGMPTPPIFGAGLKILPANFSGFAR